MSEEQGKPRRKWYKRQPNRYDKFALVCFVCIACIAVYLIWGSKGLVDPPSIRSLYHFSKIELQNAVNDYQNRNNGALPAINGTVTINGSAYAIINICSLLTQDEESLQTVIESLWCGNGSNDDNWDGGCAECTAYSSYVWAVDDEGNVYSTCVGEYCNTSGVDSYQDVWP